MTITTELIAELFDSYAANELTNRAARALEAQAKQIEALNADLKHTEECCVQWATDYGNSLKQIEALQANLSAIEALECVGEVETITVGFGDTEKLDWRINWTRGHILPHSEKLYANAKVAQSNTLDGIMQNLFYGL